MSQRTEPVSLQQPARDPGPHPELRISSMATGLIGSEILKIAAEIRERVKGGAVVYDFTVGDFSPKEFPIPGRLLRGVHDALEAGATNYPPSNGVLELREAVVRFYERELGLGYSLDNVLVASGARPLIYGIYRAVVDAGDRVLYPVPSWNNNHYVHMLGAKGVQVPCDARSYFMPTPEAVAAALPGTRLVCINTPLNPTGTAITRQALHGICEAIVAENRERDRRNERPVYLMYDHIYWMLCVEGTEHVTPPGLMPEMARYTIFVDGISKAFAATGLRVGWAVGPTDVVARMAAILGHVGAWAPRAEQLGSAVLLDDSAAIADYHAGFRRNVTQRLQILHEGLQALRREGLAVDSMTPMGAIYLTAHLAPFGRRTPSGQVLQTNEDVRRYVLEAAGLGIVPFQAFGVSGDTGWFRLSVGAVSEKDCQEAIPRLAQALRALL